MNTLLPIAYDLMLLAGISAAILLAGLCLRNPHAPSWLSGEAVASAAALVLTGAICFVAVDTMQSFAAAKIDFAVAAVAVPGTIAVSLAALWKILGVGVRLVRADAGLSPFRSIAEPPPHPGATAPA